MSALRTAAEQALWAFELHVQMTWPMDRSTAAIANLRAALAQFDGDGVPKRSQGVESMEAKQTPLIELLERVPQDARVVVEHDQFSSSSHPVGRLCHEAAAALRAALAQQAEPVQEPVATTQQPVVEKPPSDYRRGYWDGFAIGKREGRIEAEDAAKQAEPVDAHTTTLRALLEHCMSWEPDACVLGNVTAQDAAAALRAALAQEQAEPVQEQDIEDAIEAAYWHFDARKKGLNEWASAPQSERDAFKAEARKLVKGYFLTRQAQEQAEPIAWLQPKTVDGYSRPDLGYETCSKSDYGAFAVYTAPPQRQPLTEEESDNIYREFMLYQDRLTPSVLQRVVRAIERAHGIIESEIKVDSHQTLDDAMQQPRAIAQAYESGYKAGQTHERERIIQFLQEMQRVVGDAHNHYGVAAMRIRERV